MTNKCFLLTAVLLLLLCTQCVSPSENQNTNTNAQGDFIELHGNTQGTSYTIICNDSIEISTQGIDSILDAFDLALNTYIASSAITRINESDAGEIKIADTDEYFRTCYHDAVRMYRISDGAFDPTVGPLMNAWGFKKDSFTKLDSNSVDSIMKWVSFKQNRIFSMEVLEDSVGSDTLLVKKRFKNASLDFNAIAQGYAVDVLYNYLDSIGAKNYYVFIGGEVRVKGNNAEGNNWRIGVDKPIPENTGHKNRKLAPSVINLTDLAVATSGNYRKFYKEDGKIYVHTLNPKTGYPIQQNLLSATIVADRAAIADAMATTFMVVGQEKGMEILRKMGSEVLGAYLIFSDKDGNIREFTSPNIERLIHDL